MRFSLVLIAAALAPLLPVSQAAAQDSRAGAPGANADQKIVAETQVATELWRRAREGCMQPVLLGLLQRTQDRAELREQLAVNCEAIVKAARDHLRAANVLGETAPSPREIALGMADELVRERLGAPENSNSSAPALRPGGVLMR